MKMSISPSLFQSKNPDPHRAPGCPGEDFPALVDEAFAFLVLVVLVVPLHVEHVQVRPAVPVDVAGRGVSGPAHVPQTGLPGDVPEQIAALVAVEDALLEALGHQVAGERVAVSVVERVVDAVIGCLAQLVGGVLAHVGEEQVQQAIVVVVEEHRTRRMAFVPGAGCLGDVPEGPAADVLEQAVSRANGGDVEVRIAVVVDVRERGRHGDAVGEGDTRLVGDVFELAAAGIPPQRVSAGLGDEQDVHPAVVVDVGRSDAVAVIVVHRLVAPRRVFKRCDGER